MSDPVQVSVRQGEGPRDYLLCYDLSVNCIPLVTKRIVGDLIFEYTRPKDCFYLIQILLHYYVDKGILS